MFDFLFARPSFLSGMASVLDVGSTLRIYNESPNSAIADARAIHSDWCAVGNDIRFAMSQYETPQNGKKK
jgi:hypothetical protein